MKYPTWNSDNDFFDSKDLVPAQVGKTSLSRLSDSTHGILNSFCSWSWTFLSDQNTSLSTLNGSMYSISCYHDSFDIAQRHFILQLSPQRFIRFFQKIVTAVSWAFSFPDDVFLSGWSKNVKSHYSKTRLGKMTLKGHIFFLFLGQTQLHI